MPPKIGNNNVKIAGELRRSQTITTFGSGAIVDLPRLSGIMSGIDTWQVQQLPEEAKIHERNLEMLLGKEFFYQVSSPETESGNTFGIEVYRFPSWYYCPKCHKLDYYSKIAKTTTGNTSDYNRELVCATCSTSNEKVKLIPSRFIAACLNGHIEDFPYIWWAHRKKEICKSPKLTLTYKGSTGGLDGIHIKCETCGSETTMAGCMDKESLKVIKCRGNMPWLGFKSEGKGWYKDPELCNAVLRVLQRSANNVYYPVNQSALTIPPWSNKIQAVFAAQNSKFSYFFDEENDETIRLLKKDYLKNKDKYKIDEQNFISQAYLRYRNQQVELNEKTLRSDEYKAFCGSDIAEDSFKTVSVDVPDEFANLVNQIKLVKKLREVMVLQGFRRILPISEPDPQERTKLGLSNNDFSPLSKQPLPWLPAIELFGEGIFIEFNEKAVCEWEQRNHTRYIKMGQQHQGSWIGNEMFNSENPRYVLLHTFAHLFIRQLVAQCGYATASIKEKIYSTLPDTLGKMCGVLIYTSATDTDGSLGGLVREGNPDRIEITLKNLLQESSWCSNDPICIESMSQGFKGMNYAACHACALLPETSCESLNCLLDRASITGTPDNKDIAYFRDFL